MLVAQGVAEALLLATASARMPREKALEQVVGLTASGGERALGKVGFVPSCVPPMAGNGASQDATNEIESPM
jgi:hypothetical protein